LGRLSPIELFDHVLDKSALYLSPTDLKQQIERALALAMVK
jgi:hypothetical protein